jgi:hypothetical protein
MADSPFKPARRQKGTIFAFLIILAAFIFFLIVGLISTELFVQWVTRSKMQSGAQNGALAFARELIKLRDNEIGEVARGQRDEQQRTRTYNTLFENTQRTRSCDARSNYSGCSRANQATTGVMGIDAPSPGGGNQGCANFIECINASQILLFEVRSRANPVEDAGQIRDISKNQCHAPVGSLRFNKIRGVQLPNCQGPVGMVISPITQLDWRFEAAGYGTRAPCMRVSRDAQLNRQKDFCVEAEVSARIDPIIAGGLPFLHNILFINPGQATLRARAIVMRPDFVNDPNQAANNQPNRSRQDVDEYFNRGEVNNFSSETVTLESCNSFGGNCQ